MTCSLAICSDCAMFGLEHKGHEFQHLSNIHEKHVENIKHEAQSLRKRLKDLALILHNLDTNIEKIRKNKEDKSNELVVSMEQMQAKLDSQLKAKLQGLRDHRNEVCEEIEHLEDVHVDLNKQLGHLSKSKLIAKSNEIIKSLKEIQSKPISKAYSQSTSTEFISEIAPDYDSGIFEIQNFTRLRSTTEVIYSDQLQACGLS